jgi:hypothetical protein
VMYLDAENWLHVRVEGAQWMQQFVSMRSALANDLGRIAGVKVGGIHFKSREQGPGFRVQGKSNTE